MDPPRSGHTLAVSRALVIERGKATHFTEKLTAMNNPFHIYQ